MINEDVKNYLELGFDNRLQRLASKIPSGANASLFDAFFELGERQVKNGNLSDGAVDSEKIMDLAIEANNIASNAITETKISDDAVVTRVIAANAIGADQIAANAVVAAKIAAGQITATHIGTNEVIANSANIKNAIITSAKIASLNADKINVGTLTGFTIQTATSGKRVRMSTLQGIQFLDGDNQKGYLYVSASGQMILDADDYIALIADGAGDDILINSNDSLQLVSDGGNIITQSSGNTTVFCDRWTVGFNNDDDGEDCYWASGSSPNVRMKLTSSGNATCDGSFTGGGADFAEMFESVSGKEIKDGTSVVLVGNKIIPAKDGEQPIGVISARPTIIGNAGGSDSDTEWKDKYLKDELGNILTEKAEKWYITVKEKYKKPTGQKGEKKVKKTGWSDEKKAPKGAEKKIIERQIINPEYDKSKKYISRKDRPEWNIVGLIGIVMIKKGQPISPNWIKLRDISDKVEEWLIK